MPEPRPPAGAAGATTQSWIGRLRGASTRPVKVVAGFGPLDFQNGADLFLACAARLLAAPVPGHDVHFVWVCTGDAPRADAYGSSLAHQIAVLGLGPSVSFVPAAELEDVLAQADAWLCTARVQGAVDIAVHAMRGGLAGVAFDQSGNLSDFLAAEGMVGLCLAPYLDTAAMAVALRRFLEEEAVRVDCAARLRAAACSAFHENDYGEALHRLGTQMADAARQQQADADLILSTDALLAVYFEPGADARPDAPLVRRYLAGWHSGLVARKPRPGFHPGVYRDASGGQSLQGDPFADYLRRGRPPGPWDTSVIRPGQPSAQAPMGLRVALHVHAFYPALLGEILQRLAVNRVRPDLYVSVGDEAALAEAHGTLEAYDGRLMQLKIVPNTGRDIGPLLTEFGATLCSQYDVIGHLHTKQSPHESNRAAIDRWRYLLLENLLGGAQGGAMADTLIEVMAHDPQVGLVFPDDPVACGWDGNEAIAREVARSMGLGPLPGSFNFPLGTMFWARSQVLQPFVGLGLGWGDYPEEPLGVDGSLLHALERLFGIVPEHAGMRCAVTWVPGVTR